MPPILLSTQEVAVTLTVAETTIKRWADKSVLPCVRTPGGHRKFLLRDVLRFADTNGYTVSGSQPPPMSEKQMERLQIGVHTQNYAKIASVLKEEALHADRGALTMLLVYLSRQNIPLPVVLDDVILPGFTEIGRAWEEGKLGIDQEHAASHALTEALARVVQDLHRKPSNKKSALCACPGGELHELALQGLAYSLECEGWKVYYLGGNTPLESIASVVRVERPELVCLSLTYVRHRGQLIAKLRKFASSVHACDGKLLIGGQYAQRLNAGEVRCDHIAATIQEGISYVRDVFHLKPGPKQSAPASSHPQEKAAAPLASHRRPSQ
jgi:MerR family transcriptional regulator, light-induced transcriptional regulator